MMSGFVMGDSEVIELGRRIGGQRREIAYVNALFDANATCIMYKAYLMGCLCYTESEANDKITKLYADEEVRFSELEDTKRMTQFFRGEITYEELTKRRYKAVRRRLK